MKIYLASPLFSEMEKDYIEKIVFNICEELKLNTYLDFYIPMRDNKEIHEDSKYNKNIQNLNECNIMIAILDGKDVDSGCAFEIGYFEAQNKPILGLLTDTRSYYELDYIELNDKLNLMIYGSCNLGNYIYRDLDNLIDQLCDILIED